LHAYALSKKRYDFAEETARQYERAFPGDTGSAVIWRATAASQGGDIAKAQSLYEAAFRPLWPAASQHYFELLKRLDRCGSSSNRRARQRQRIRWVLTVRRDCSTNYQQQGDLATANGRSQSMRSARKHGVGLDSGRAHDARGILFEPSTLG